jgi:hypothetical protein
VPWRKLYPDFTRLALTLVAFSSARTLRRPSKPLLLYSGVSSPVGRRGLRRSPSRALKSLFRSPHPTISACQRCRRIPRRV